MDQVTSPVTDTQFIARQSSGLIEENLQRVWKRTDRMFVALMIFQWVGAIAFSLWWSPRTWAGANSSVHPHVWAAIFLGGAIASLPILFGCLLPGRALTRHTMAVGQMLMSALLIHLTGGRIETHFHVFGSLAFLAFYRDWRVILTATLVTAGDHFLRGFYSPESIFGTVVGAGSWRWLEHAGWVVFEDIFLWVSIRDSLLDVAADAHRTAELEALKNSFERQVEDRTNALSDEISERRRAETDLAAARDSALAAVRSKSQFLANMSHEIRTPMNGVIGMTSLLLDTGLDREQRDYVETIRQSGDLLLTIINDILDFSKIDAGKLAFENLDFDLREVVESTLELLAEKTQAQGLELIGQVEPEVMTHLRGDPGRLRQILTNLLNNAVKFTEHGEVVVRVSHESSTDLTTMVRFEVRDTGIGISPEAQQQLFQPFTQADSSTTRKYGGTGLGLAISRQLVEMMHGEICVQSVPGQGSTFSFTVRLEKQIPAPARRDVSDLAGLHILIVDDNATNRQILMGQLGNVRVRCSAAIGGLGALGMLRNAANGGDPYDLAILDMQMPEMNGLMLAEAINADPALAPTRLIMLSSLGHNLSMERVKAAGIEEYLVKPAKQSRLYDCVAEVMSHQKSRAASATMAPPSDTSVR